MPSVISSRAHVATTASAASIGPARRLTRATPSRFELRNRRCAFDGEHVDRAADAADERADRLGVADAGHEHAVGAGAEKRLARSIAMPSRAPRARRSSRRKMSVRALMTTRTPALVAALMMARDLVDLQRQRLQILGAGHVVLEVDADRAGGDHRSTTSATASGVAA